MPSPGAGGGEEDGGVRSEWIWRLLYTHVYTKQQRVMLLCDSILYHIIGFPAHVSGTNWGQADFTAYICPHIIGLL